MNKLVASIFVFGLGFSHVYSASRIVRVDEMRQRAELNGEEAQLRRLLQEWASLLERKEALTAGDDATRASIVSDIFFDMEDELRLLDEKLAELNEILQGVDERLAAIEEARNSLPLTMAERLSKSLGACVAVEVEEGDAVLSAASTPVSPFSGSVKSPRSCKSPLARELDKKIKETSRQLRTISREICKTSTRIGNRSGTEEALIGDLERQQDDLIAELGALEKQLLALKGS